MIISIDVGTLVFFLTCLKMLYQPMRNLSKLANLSSSAASRAILRDAPILILDEPTAALDVESEAEVMHALDKLAVNRTVLMISHRLSTLGNVDEIVVLKDGLIVEQGTYQDLKQRGGLFARLLQEQNRYNLEKIGEQSNIYSAIDIPDMVLALAPKHKLRTIKKRGKKRGAK